jgi:hypothetical protein
VGGGRAQPGVAAGCLLLVVAAVVGGCSSITDRKVIGNPITVAVAVASPVRPAVSPRRQEICVAKAVCRSHGVTRDTFQSIRIQMFVIRRFTFFALA